MDIRRTNETTTGTRTVPWSSWESATPGGDPPRPAPHGWGGPTPERRDPWVAAAPAAPRRERRGPGWGALVGATAAAALLASVGTAGLTGALAGAWDGDPERVGAVATDGAASAEPVVSSTTDDPDWASVAAAVQPSVVAIDVRTAGGAGAGSGVILDTEGRILTNDHVVGDAVEGGLVVTLDDGRLYEASLVGTDPATDLAVIELVDPPRDLVPAAFADSDAVVVGDPVAAVGNPLGLTSTVTTGIVSALDRPVATTDTGGAPGQGTTVVTNAIQVDAAVNPGNSGGPLFDAAGRVIGINSSIASLSNGAGGSSGSIGLGFAIPADLATQVADQLVEDGVAEHAYLGVYMEDTTADVDGTRRAGAGIADVEPGTPADEAGLRRGDVITAIDGDRVSGAESLTGFVRQHAAGDSVTLSVVRDGEALDLTVTLATRAD